MAKRTTIDRAQDYKGDFMQTAGKGGEQDPLVRQQAGDWALLSDEEITRLYAGNQIIQNIVDIPAEDATREWITLEMEDEKLARALEKRLETLNAPEAIEKMVAYDRLRGDGFVSIGVTQGGRQWTLDDPINIKSLRSIDYLHPFSRLKLTKFLINVDPFDPSFGDVEKYQINPGHTTMDDSPLQRDVHKSRLLHLQTKRIEDRDWGQSILEPMKDIITVFDTSLWSVGQILYDFTFKVFKSNQAEGMTKEDMREAQMLMDYMFRTEALAIIESDEELKKEATQVNGVEQLLTFVWDVLAGSAKMPKSHLLGQQSGTISGAQYDSLNYYARIAGTQENFLRPKIEYLVRLLLWASDEPGGQIDPDTIDWKVKFNPLWRLDDQTDADIRKKQAETDSIYLKNQVLTPDEVRQKRFEMGSLMDELEMPDDPNGEGEGSNGEN
ncbi:DUF1073 domain-containing protein [Salibacterium halotolerans]|uniref:Anti-CBASS protein Acb1-like N-terminal domain-containing protein n=1 Tax=Salibacterium halotolerans TaxID=1884432 RepID=A0A1I5N9M8_9BACI|nr:anti-CBASS Acb1 family protein [Salibacterium halotolerans]SFP18397.1 hypothetical protein SAMN05518683_10347 [Salibacterium halotolerans]